MSDDIVEDLLKSPYTAALQRSRNAAFHAQKEYLSKKLLDRDLDQDAFIDWVSALHDALPVWTPTKRGTGQIREGRVKEDEIGMGIADARLRVWRQAKDFIREDTTRVS